MTDRDLVQKKLAFIETCVAEIRALGRPDAVDRDVRELRFLLYTLQTAIQAILDVASHVVSSERMGEPDSNRELIRILVRRGWIPERLGATLVLMVGFRNLIVHGYEKVEPQEVRRIAKTGLADLLKFVKAIRARL